MDENAGEWQVRRPFRAVLAPHRSLPPAGFLALMIGFGAVSFISGMVFLLMGAWPVFGFFGLDVAILYVAFRLNYRSARIFETVEVEPAEVRVTRVDPQGRRQAFAFETAWVRVRLDEGVDGRTALRLAHHAQQLTLGAFLTDDERRSLAAALDGALIDARGGPRI